MRETQKIIPMRRTCPHVESKKCSGLALCCIAFRSSLKNVVVPWLHANLLGSQFLDSLGICFMFIRLEHCRGMECNRFSGVWMFLWDPMNVTFCAVGSSTKNPPWRIKFLDMIPLGLCMWSFESWFALAHTRTVWTNMHLLKRTSPARR